MTNNDNKFNRFSNEVLKSEKLIVENSTRLFKQFINTSLIILSLAIVGCFDFVNFQFSLELLSTSKYWIHLVMRAAVLVLMYNAGINIFWDKFIATDETLNKYKLDYEEKSKLKDTNFEEFIERVLNPKIKKEAYIAHIKKKIYKLDKHAKDYDKLLFASILEERQEEKLKNKYCKKKQKLLDLISDDFIKNQLPYINVKYQRIDAAVFSMDINGEANVSNYKVKSSVGKSKTSNTAKGLISMLLCSIFVSSILLDPNFDELIQQTEYLINAMINIVMDLIFSGWQLFRGTLDAPKIINQEYTIAYANRCRVLDEYINWNSNNPESKAHKITQFIDKQATGEN